MVRFFVILRCSFICAFSAPSTSVRTIFSLKAEAKTAHLSTCKMSFIIRTSESLLVNHSPLGTIVDKLTAEAMS